MNITEIAYVDAIGHAEGSNMWKNIWPWMKGLCDPGSGLHSPAERRGILLTNITIFVTVFMNFMHIPPFLLPEFKYGFLVVILNLITNGLLAFCFFMNRSNKSGMGKKLFFSLVILEFTYMSVLLGTHSGMYHYLTCCMLASFLAFAPYEKRSKYCAIFSAFFLYGFFIFNQLFTSWFLGPHTVNVSILSASAMILSILINIIIVAIVHSEQIQMESRLNFEYRRSEHLLNNIFPKAVSEQLKQSGHQMIANRIPDTTILFADIVGFTRLTESMGAEPVVSLLNKLFSYYDDLAGKFGLEKIKTIGDAYMVAAGVPKPSRKHGDQIAEMALEMMAYTEKIAKESKIDIRLRIGINSGSVIAGVIGKRKFQFDIWGDCVNTASRMESSGVAGKIQVSESTFELLKENWNLGERGYTDIKGLGKRRTWFLNGAKPALRNVA